MDCFEKGLQAKIGMDRRYSIRESLEHEEPFNDSSFKETPKSIESFQTSHKNKSIFFSAALSKIPEKKMSNISILDFKDMLTQSHVAGYNRGSLKSNEKAKSKFGDGMRMTIEGFRPDKSDDGGAKSSEESYFGNKEDSYEQTSETDVKKSARPSLKRSQKESIFTNVASSVNHHERAHRRKTGCCILI